MSWSNYEKRIFFNWKKWTYNDSREVGIEDAFLLIVFPMNLQKMCAKIVDNSFKIVGAVTKRRDAERQVKLVARTRSKNWTYYLETRTPLASLLCKTSVLSINWNQSHSNKNGCKCLLKKRTRWIFFKSRFEHMEVNSWRESSILFVRGSSSRYYSKPSLLRHAIGVFCILHTWSNALIGATKIIAFASSK